MNGHTRPEFWMNFLMITIDTFNNKNIKRRQVYADNFKFGSNMTKYY